jgi:hypothetical protein
MHAAAVAQLSVMPRERAARDRGVDSRLASGFSRSTNSTRSARLFAVYSGGYGSPDNQDLQDKGRARPHPSGDVIRRYLSKISSRLR